MPLAGELSLYQLDSISPRLHIVEHKTLAQGLTKDMALGIGSSGIAVEPRDVDAIATRMGLCLVIQLSRPQLLIPGRRLSFVGTHDFIRRAHQLAR